MIHSTPNHGLDQKSNALYRDLYFHTLIKGSVTSTDSGLGFLTDYFHNHGVSLHHIHQHQAQNHSLHHSASTHPNADLALSRTSGSVAASNRSLAASKRPPPLPTAASAHSSSRHREYMNYRLRQCYESKVLHNTEVTWFSTFHHSPKTDWFDQNCKRNSLRHL